MEFIMLRIGGLLNREIKIFQRLLEAIQQQHHLLSKGEHKALIDLMNHQKDLLRELHLVEMDKLEECQLLAKKLNIKNDEVTLYQLLRYAENVNPRYTEKLRKLGDCVGHLIKRIMNNNIENMKLIHELQPMLRRHYPSQHSATTQTGVAHNA